MALWLLLEEDLFLPWKEMIIIAVTLKRLISNFQQEKLDVLQPLIIKSEI